ncbi:aminotransferase class IV [Pseudodesulfovibrio sp. zrk46]|uniref:aminotransferase class IV n=1 Tax=Pseudodesulfovibrio sp. zrk46 TaxID=2725288 RepID=UPI001448BECA|nr:aminotransferase class IV [Pseudodesulfovibrio sp. zrk46]QJB55995.1 aminotransferase class IV [Pseudodesulfovibrio sp. zrk46]
MIHYYQGKYSHEGVALNPAAPAFRYGTGFFETIYYNGTKLCHLDRHLDRLLHSLRAYRIDHETIDFTEVIMQVINRNGLEGNPARINIFYPVEEPTAQPVILAAPYEPAPYKAYRLCICNDKHVSTLNAQKTTSYMFFHLALKQAKARGFDDAALFDFDNNLLEATTGAIVLRKNGNFVELDTEYKLPSTTLQLAKTVLDIQPESVNYDDLPQYRHAYLLNTLIGMRPIVAIGETAFVPDEEACRDVTELVLEE